MIHVVEPGPDRLVEAKRSFYRKADVAAEYNARRFGGAGGGYVNRREAALVSQLLPANAGIIADVGTGTGRLLPMLSARGGTVIGLDASRAMLQEASSVHAGGLVQGDAFHLPVRDAACDAVTSLRVLFHFEQVEPLLAEMRRITKPDGVLVCDTASWSPRSWLPLDREHWGERVATIENRRFAQLARGAGWEVLQTRACFLISPYVYRRLPVALSRLLEGLEGCLPRELLCRAFWALRARPDTASRR